MYRKENPLHYRRNAISIAPETVRNGPGRAYENRSDNRQVPAHKSRLMSTTDETSDPRLRKILSRFALNDDGKGGLGSRLTKPQINGTKQWTCMICY
jgi:hypothetical protein